MSFTHRAAEAEASVYALDALDDDSHQRLENHLEECDLAHPDIAGALAVASALAYLVRPVDPPAALRARIMLAVAQEARSVI